MTKIVLINRAVPGSGKTSFTKKIREAVEAVGFTMAVHSTDEYFMRDGRYVFDLSKLARYHAENLLSFKQSLSRGTDLVVVDNTNIHPWETEPYTAAARAAGSRIVFLNFAPRALELHLAAQQVTPEKPDAHEVPEDALREHIEEFHRYNDLLEPGVKPDLARHPNYQWDDLLQDVVPTAQPCPPFDFDDVIQISPQTYHQEKERIGSRILALLGA